MAERNSNLELYRVITMFLIVCHHYVVNSGLMQEMAGSPLSANSIFFYLFGMWGKIGINCFVLITGYFMCLSPISLSKFVKLYLWIVFYRILIRTVFLLMGRIDFSPELLYVFFPFRNVHSDHFTEAYLVWWLFIPFLSVVVNNIERKMHLLLMALMLFVFSLYPFVPKILNIESNPICWFSTLFVVASYIRKYPCIIYRESSAKFWGIISIGCITLSICSVISILWLGNYIGRILPQYYMICDSDKPLALLVAVSTFMFFKNLKMKHYSIINALGATSFGVLLIHSGMRQWLWSDVVKCVEHYDTPFYPLYAIGCCITIYVVCSLIDYARLKLIEPQYMKVVPLLAKKSGNPSGV